MSETPEQPETLIEFPCDFAIKAMGLSGDGLDELVVSIVCEHAELCSEDAVSLRQSSGGKFTSVTVMIRAISKPQLDTIYQALSDHDRIKYVL
jgi:hypothetical protein